MKLNNLFKDEYQCMFLSETNINLGKKYYEVKIDSNNFDDEKFLQYIKYRGLTIVFEKTDVGTLVFSNVVAYNPFEMLQKKYKENASYYFWASDTLGNFKILKDGKIQRKFASKGYFYDNIISSEEQVLGTPCEYEIKNNKIYKMKYNEYTVKISKKEMGEIFDFYIPLNRDEDIKFDSIKIYYNIDNMKYSTNNFLSSEFLQTLIHVGKNKEYEYTKPLLIFKQKNILRFAFFKNKCLKSNIKNAKNLLNLGFFNKLDKKLTKTDLFYLPYYLGDYIFASHFSDAIIEALKPEENYKTTYSEYLELSNSEGEYIGKESSIFYFSAEFIDGKFNLKIYSILKNGNSLNHEFVAEINNFEKNSLIIFYNQILDYIFDDNIADKLVK